MSMTDLFSRTPASELPSMSEVGLKAATDLAHAVRGASEQDAVRIAYTNYFSDASLFLGLLDGAFSELGEMQTVGPRRPN